MYSITEKDFDRLWNTSMDWFGVDWEEQEGRFEIDEPINYKFKRAYWFDDNWANIMFAKIFLTDKNEDYQVLWDLSMMNWCIITNWKK